MNGLPAVFGVRVRMLSDWIVGTGEGRAGDVDATVRRDGDGLPFVPAKTLTGIWRDACEQVAAWLAAEPGPGVWLAWVEWLFGSQPDAPGDWRARAGRAPRPAALSLSPARLPSPVRDACRGRPALRAAAVLPRPGVAIDQVTGVARDEMFRLEERARPALLEAEARITLAGGGAVPEAAELLLRAGAAAIDGLGGKRNRGAGRCWLLLPGMAEPPGPPPLPAAPRPADERLAEFAARAALLADPGPPPAPAFRPAARLAVPAASAVSIPNGTGAGQAPDRRAMTYRITFEVVTPLVAQQRVLANVVMSRDFVPGSVLLPEILARLDGEVPHRDVVVGDARPAVMGEAGAVAGLPAPMIWHRPKERHRHDVVNAAHRRPAATERRKPMRSGHVVPAGADTWALLSPAMAVSTHAVIDDDAGRPTPERGGVFTYLGLAPGTLLGSDVVVPAGVGLRLAVGERLRLGRSRKDDFGEVRVTAVRVPGDEAAAPGIPAGAEVRVWCTSSVLLRDGWGAPDPSPAGLAAELAARLGVTVDPVAQEHGGPERQAYRAERRESFQARWGRPRPSLVGLAAGSVITVRFSGPVSGAALAALERDGLGERTAEGFGQVRFGAPEVLAASPRLIPAAGPGGLGSGGGAGGLAAPGGAGSDGNGLPAAPDALERAAVLAEIRRRVAGLVNAGPDAVVPGASQVSSRAQWGSLRDQAARLGAPGGPEAVARWFEQTRAVRQRRAVWGEPALNALARLLTGEDEVWAVLGLDGQGMDPFVYAPSRAGPVREVLRTGAVLALVDELGRDAVRTLQAGRSGEVEPREARW